MQETHGSCKQQQSHLEFPEFQNLVPWETILWATGLIDKQQRKKISCILTDWEIGKIRKSYIYPWSVETSAITELWRKFTEKGRTVCFAVYPYYFG